MTSFYESYRCYLVVIHDFKTGKDIQSDREFQTFDEANEFAKSELISLVNDNDSEKRYMAAIKLKSLIDIRFTALKRKEN